MKHLLLCVLVACSSAEPPGALVAWLDQWEAARRCWVGEASYDLETALAVTELSGRSCRHALHVDLGEVDDGLAAPWTRAMRGADALHHERDVAARAHVIDQVDRDVARLRGLAGIAEPVRRVERPLQLLAGDLAHEREHLPAQVETAALEAGGGRLIVRRRAHGQWQLEQSKDGGSTWRRVTRPRSRLAGLWQDPRTGTIDQLFHYDGDLWMLQITRDSLPSPTVYQRLWVNEPGMPRIECRSARATWISAPGRLAHVAGGAVATMSVSGERHDSQVACDDANAVVLHRGPDAVEHCTAGACTPVLALAHRQRGAVGWTPDGWIYAASLAGVVGVWRANDAPRFYRLARPGEVTAIEVIEGAPYLVVGGRAIKLPRVE